MLLVIEIPTVISDEDYEANGQHAWYYHQQLLESTSDPTMRALEYLVHERGLTYETLNHFTVGHVPNGAFHVDDYTDEVPAGHNHLRGYISIPYINERGVTAIRFRAMPGLDGPKYLDLPGAGTWLYNVTAANHGGHTITVCEGEIDTMTAHQMGLHAIGLSGVQKWKPHHRHLLEGYGHIRILADGDEAGREMGERIKIAMPNAFVELLPAPEGMDVNSAYLEAGTEQLLNYWGITPDNTSPEEE